jgi:hypothetical protein
MNFSKGRIMVMNKFISLDKFYESRLSGLKAVDPKEMGVACDVGITENRKPSQISKKDAQKWTSYWLSIGRQR